MYRMCRLAALVSLVFLVGGLGSCVELLDQDDGLGTTAPPQANGEQGNGSSTQPQEVADRIAGSVVEVRAVVSSSLFRQQFGTGGGVVYRADGIVVTNDHVIRAGGEEPVDEIIVILASGDELEAEVVGREPDADLAVLRIDAPDLEPVQFIEDFSLVEEGQQVVAIGSRALAENVTTGTVTRILRGVHSPAVSQLDTLIQTDVPVQQGNSGGPLVNLDGMVIGIILAGTQDMQGAEEGLGMAIPAPTVISTVDELLGSAEGSGQ